MVTELSKYVDYHKKKNELLKQKIEKKRLSTLKEAKKIGRIIGKRINPVRIYIFGSALDPDLFETYSDLDIAVEGLSVKDFYKAHSIAEEISTVSLDFVNFNRVEDFVKERILRTGKIIYEKK